MKTDILVRLSLIALFGSASALASDPTETPTPTPIIMGGCNRAKLNTEAYRFYGAPKLLLEDIATIPADTVTRRAFLQITQGKASTEVKFYERQENSTFTVTVWKVEKASRLLVDLDQAIIDNKGVNCIGEQVKGVLAKDLKEGHVTEGVAPPVSPMAAFDHSVKEATGDFIQTTIVIFC